MIGALRRVRAPFGASFFSGVAWNTVDQALYSLSNAGLSVLVARTTTAEGFGEFSFGVTAFMLVIALSRAVVNQPYMIRHGDPDVDRGVAPRPALGLALLVGAAGLVALVLGAVALGAVPMSPLVVVALALPCLFAQDALRTVYVVAGSPGKAVLNDLLWAVIQFGLAFLLITDDVTSPVAFTLVWAIGGAVSLAVGILAGRLWPQWRGGLRFLRRNLDLSRYMVVESAVVMGASQAVLLIIGIVSSPVDLGALRGAQTVLGPLNIIGFGVMGVLVPELVRRGRAGWTGHRRAAMAVSVVLLAINVGWGGFLLLMPDAWGTAILGDTWPAARALIVPMTIFFAAVATSNAPLAVLRALGQVRSSFRVYLVLSPMTLVLPLLGQYLLGVQGAAWGLAVASVVILPIWWWTMSRAMTVLGRPDARVTEVG